MTFWENFTTLESLRIQLDDVHVTREGTDAIKQNYHHQRQQPDHDYPWNIAETN